MRKYILEFIRRGITACGLGPIVLAFIYMIAQHFGELQILTVQEVCVGIFSLSALAFVAGGLNVLYQIERLPLMIAISIHGGTLYLIYLITYLINNWLGREITPILVFTGIFLIGYVIIWAIIYLIIRNNTADINKKMNKKHTEDI